MFLSPVEDLTLHVFGGGPTILAGPSMATAPPKTGRRIILEEDAIGLKYDANEGDARDDARTGGPMENVAVCLNTAPTTIQDWEECVDPGMASSPGTDELLTATPSVGSPPRPLTGKNKCRSNNILNVLAIPDTLDDPPTPQRRGGPPIPEGRRPGTNVLMCEEDILPSPARKHDRTKEYEEGGRNSQRLPPPLNGQNPLKRF